MNDFVLGNKIFKIMPPISPITVLLKLKHKSCVHNIQLLRICCSYHIEGCNNMEFNLTIEYRVVSFRLCYTNNCNFSISCTKLTLVEYY